MATVTGAISTETLTPDFVSPTMTTSGGRLSSDAPDIVDSGGGNKPSWRRRRYGWLRNDPAF